MPDDRDDGLSYQGPIPLEVVVCFGANGSLLPGEKMQGLPASFLTNILVQPALQASCASGTTDAGEPLGSVYLYAVAVPNRDRNGDQGVVVVGESIQQQQNALSLLLTLLLSVGGGALLCAGLGGLFLASRALVPARLAWANQQRFIADASHELRTPLTLLRADAEVLLRGRASLDTEDAALLEDIVAEANHMSSITTSLLTLARLDSQFEHREHEVIELAQLARQGIQRVQALADQSSITIQQESSGNAYVIGDPLQLEQALLILLENAIKYNRQAGSISVRTATRDGQAQLEVSDTGIGIAAEHLPNLGQRFYRVDKARSREAGGTGLGLSIARRIIHAHGGQLILSSVPNEGTTATIKLPLARET